MGKFVGKRAHTPREPTEALNEPSQKAAIVGGQIRDHLRGRGGTPALC